MALSRDWQEFVESFLSEEVEFIIVGAFAMAHHRLPRLTGDIDFFVSTGGNNPERICRAIENFGFGSLGLTPEDFRKADQIVQIGRPPNRVDLLTTISGVTFEEAWENRSLGPLNGFTVPYLSRELLIKNKEASGRDKDLLDVKLLKKGRRNR